MLSEGHLNASDNFPGNSEDFKRDPITFQLCISSVKHISVLISTLQGCRYKSCLVSLDISKLCTLSTLFLLTVLTLSSLAILVDSSRVFLSSSEPERDYINASFVDVSK